MKVQVESDLLAEVMLKSRKMKKVAIIGAKGFIGRHLSWYLKTKMGILANCYDIIDICEEHYYKVDMTEPGSVKGIDLDVDYIFFMTGLTGTKQGFEKYATYVKINELTLLNLLDAIKQSEYRPKVVFPSSRLVYKGIDKALCEEDIKESKTIYAANKLACEGYLRSYYCNFDIPYSIFRICVPYGNMLDNNYSFGTIGFFIKMAEAGKDITLYGGGTLKRTFTHLEDLCSQMINGAFNPLSDGNVYNIGGEAMTLFDAAKIIAHKYGVNVVSIPWPREDLKLESGHTYFDDSKIQQLLGGYHYIHNLTDIFSDL